MMIEMITIISNNNNNNNNNNNDNNFIDVSYVLVSLSTTTAKKPLLISDYLVKAMRRKAGLAAKLIEFLVTSLPYEHQANQMRLRRRTFGKRYQKMFGHLG